MRFSYTALENTPNSLMPRLAITLHLEDSQMNAVGLLDTGSTINVLPYSLGLALGAVWEKQPLLSQLVGNLGGYESRGLVVYMSHPQLTVTPVQMVFAWTQADNLSVILGQMNFFMEFDVCFYRSQQIFDIHLKV